MAAGTALNEEREGVWLGPVAFAVWGEGSWALAEAGGRTGREPDTTVVPPLLQRCGCCCHLTAESSSRQMRRQAYSTSGSTVSAAWLASPPLAPLAPAGAIMA